MTGREPALFALLCLIWGTTWIAIKAGVEGVPPLLFAGTRFAVAGLVLAGLHLLMGGSLAIRRSDLARFGLAASLMVALCYGLLFWGTQFISSGLAGVLEMSLTPIALLFFAVLLGDERFDPARAASIVLGVLGILVLFMPALGGSMHARGLIGSVAVSAAAAAYGLGAVLSRPLGRTYSSLALSASMMVAGGVSLVMAALLFEPGARVMLGAAWPGAAVAGWLYLVLFGSLLGYPIYMHLLKVWGASRSGGYAFGSSVVAVLAGRIVFGEELDGRSLVAMTILLCAAWLAMRPSRDRKSVV